MDEECAPCTCCSCGCCLCSSKTPTLARPTMWPSGGGTQGRMGCAAWAWGALVALLVRWCVGLGTHSGHDNAPLFGDYEAQRHWMEVTTHLPATEWYAGQHVDNDLQYWGLDYPPLSAYWAWLCGGVAHAVQPEWVALRVSRGIADVGCKVFMRSTVVVVDALVWLPAVVYVVHVLARHVHVPMTTQQRWKCTLLLWLNPALLLIDHGHFQYNGVCLGFVYVAIGAVLDDHCVLSCVAFTAALNFKHMALYFAPTFFFMLLGKAIREETTWLNTLKRVLVYGVIVIGCFAVIWFPFIRQDAHVHATQVLHRLFPVARGLFEDKVANFWCCSSLLFKWKHVFTSQTLFRISGIVTVLSFLPSNLLLLWKPSRSGFVVTLSITSLSFFLFSFQVHEKNILLPLCAFVLLTPATSRVTTGASVLASFSMVPLLQRDGLLVPYAAVVTAYMLVTQCGGASEPQGGEAGSGGGKQQRGIVVGKGGKRTREKKGGSGRKGGSGSESGSGSCLHTIVLSLVLVGCVLIHLVHWAWTPPPRYPDLVVMMYACWSCGVFAFAWLVLHVSAWRATATYQRVDKSKTE